MGAPALVTDAQRGGLPTLWIAAGAGAAVWAPLAALRILGDLLAGGASGRVERASPPSSLSAVPALVALGLFAASGGLHGLAGLWMTHAGAPPKAPPTLPAGALIATTTESFTLALALALPALGLGALVALAGRWAPKTLGVGEPGMLRDGRALSAVAVGVGLALWLGLGLPGAAPLLDLGRSALMTVLAADGAGL